MELLYLTARKALHDHQALVRMDSNRWKTSKILCEERFQVDLLERKLSRVQELVIGSRKHGLRYTVNAAVLGFFASGLTLNSDIHLETNCWDGEPLMDVTKRTIVSDFVKQLRIDKQDDDQRRLTALLNELSQANSSLDDEWDSGILYGNQTRTSSHRRPLLGGSGSESTLKARIKRVTF